MNENLDVLVKKVLNELANKDIVTNKVFIREHAKKSVYYQRKVGLRNYTSMNVYEVLFQPKKIGTMEVKNRFVMPAMGTNYAEADGTVSQQMIDYYVERAKGGFGLCVVEVTAIHPAGKAISRQVGLFSDKFIDGFKKLVDGVHKEGAKICIQLHHCGRQTTPETNGGYTPVAPTSIICPVNQVLPHELTTEEVYQTIEDFAMAARRAKEAGADAIELNGAHGYLIAQFMSPYSNKRLDEFGGNFTSRMRFPIEIIRAIRSEIGSGMPIIFRFSGEDKVEGGRDITEGQMIARMVTENGVDAVSISNGTYASLSWMSGPGARPQGYNSYAAEAVKKVVDVPVITAGCIKDPQVAKELILQGKADFVALGRTSIADPEFPNKTRINLVDEISPCISCLQGCLGQLFVGDQVGCLINPFTGKEGTMKITQTDSPKKVVVVGGGPAGLEAAWISAKRGHDVVLYEEKEVLGGQFRLAGIPSTKHDIITALKYYIRMCDKYGVEIKLGNEFTDESMRVENPDAVIIATGGKPLIPNIKGINNPRFVDAIDVLDGRKPVGNKV